ALFRELAEEIGLRPEHVEVLGSTGQWLRYRLPARYQRHDSRPLCIGQKQIWFLLRLIGEESAVRLDASDMPEFDAWRWVDYWHPVEEVIFFKRQVYRQALTELERLLSPA
ncbi:MAG: RNA pyrophosphohydrolase, partial [Gammaproteobacteria bacterium]